MPESNLLAAGLKNLKDFCIKVETQGYFHIGLKLTFDEVNHRYF